jgi:hypothetical protein
MAMTRDDWDTIFVLDNRPLRLTYPWHFVCEITGDWALLRLRADGEWSCLGDAVRPCGANGHVDLPLQQDRLLVPTSAPGTLIGKFGGSIASRSDGSPFVIGSYCFVAVPDKKIAQLYIGINGAVASASELTWLRLEISAVLDP